MKGPSAEILDYCASMSQRWSKQAARRGTEVGSGLLFADPKRVPVAWGVSGLPSPACPLYGQARKSLSVLGLGLDFFLILFVRLFVFGMVMVAGKRWW